MTELARLLDAGTGWLSELPAYQRALVSQLAETRDLEAVARAWLEAAPPETVGYGAFGGGRIFYEKVLDQIHDLLCDSSKFVDERANLLREYGPGKSGLAAGIAMVIGPQLGTAAPMLTPVVAVVLLIVGQATLKAWCEMQSERRSGRQSGGMTP
jgi:hypothetical protein